MRIFFPRRVAYKFLTLRDSSHSRVILALARRFPFLSFSHDCPLFTVRVPRIFTAGLGDCEGFSLFCMSSCTLLIVSAPSTVHGPARVGASLLVYPRRGKQLSTVL